MTDIRGWAVRSVKQPLEPSCVAGNEIFKAANALDFLLITVNTPLDWAALLKTSSRTAE